MALRNIFGSRNRPGSSFDPVKPETAFAVIGDVHGRLDLLVRLIARLPEDLPIICVGDLVDRGPDSAGVLRYVADHPDVSSLMGNHEAMMLAFLADPLSHGPVWLRNGGLQTLNSFGVSGVPKDAGGDALQHARDDLFDAMGSTLIKWVAGLDFLFASGNVAIVHAGADPHLPLSENATNTFVWGHPGFVKNPRSDGMWIAHGHTIVDQPKMTDGRISVDTGAYATDHLTAAIVERDSVDFITT